MAPVPCEKFTFDNGCPVEVVKDIQVKVPVFVRSDAEIGNVHFECNGHHVERENCPENCCEKFTIVQEIQVRIPVKFTAECEVCEKICSFDNPDDCDDDD